MKEKLHNRRGATILMSLLLLLVATVVSVVVITVALTSAKVTDNAQAAQQAYLTVSSAAELFRDELAGQEYTRTVTRKYTETGDYIENSETTKVTFEGGCFSDLVKEAVKTILDASNPTTVTKKLEITVTGASGAELKTVKVSFTMDKDYNITALFSLPADSEPNYRIQVKLEVNHTEFGKNSTSYSGDDYTVTTTDSITWDAPEFSNKKLAN